ncbi:MAG: phosphatase PAP2 family protein [candidate division KSB1 bacterium]|nr:phosphatase PAP2 family protein [candidate division KSB1 bacterium]
MLDFLLDLDERLFVLLNSHLHCSFLDHLMPFATRLQNWTLPLGILFVGLLAFGRRQGRWAVALALLAVAASDQISSHLLKNLVGRTRPCHVVEPIRLLVACSGSFSFPSSHAANMAAAATVFALIYPHLTVPWFFFALMIGYSRIYVGVHYPLDVFGGWMVGWTIGWAVVRAWREARSHRPWLRRSSTPP